MIEVVYWTTSKVRAKIMGFLTRGHFSLENVCSVAFSPKGIGKFGNGNVTRISTAFSTMAFRFSLKHFVFQVFMYIP